MEEVNKSDQIIFEVNMMEKTITVKNKVNFKYLLETLQKMFGDELNNWNINPFEKGIPYFNTPLGIYENVSNNLTPLTTNSNTYLNGSDNYVMYTNTLGSIKGEDLPF